MKSILITGCNRGLGLGLVRTLIKQSNPPQHIFATCRDIEKAQVSDMVQNSGISWFLKHSKSAFCLN